MISVCLATYNGEKYIFTQLKSILSQLSTDDEIIISDDGSTDQTIGIIESFKDKRIKIYYHKKKAIYTNRLIRNMNYASKNFENALDYCSGEYIFLVDQDDIWLPQKAITVNEYLKKFDLVLHNYTEIDENGNIIKNKHFHINPLKATIMGNYLKLPFTGCCMAFNRKILTKTTPFPSNIITHDQWIGLKAARIGKIYFIEEPLINRRIHLTNTSLYNGKVSILTRIKYNFFIYFSNLKAITNSIL